MKGELKRTLISLIITIFVVIIGIAKNNIFLTKHITIERNRVIALNSQYNYDIYQDLDNFIEENKATFEFYLKTFGISLDDLKKVIIENNYSNRLNYNDIANIGKEYDSLDKYLIKYLFKLREEQPKLFKQVYSNGQDNNKKYIYGLLNYYSNIYSNVDYDVLASIAYIESGNLSAKYMMKHNNIYGGMSGHGLLKYQNIEYGVLVYVKMMSERYYGKGLDTVEKIAKVYNMGNTNWIKNVNSMRSKFNNSDNITNIYSLNELK